MGGDTALLTRALVVRGRSYAFQQFRVTVVRGKDADAEKLSSAREFSVGTDEGNDFKLTDPTVSRHHCTISAREDGFFLRDLGSTNATHLMGVRVEGAFLAHGALIRIGDTELRFEVLDEEIHEPLSDDNRCGPMVGASPAMRHIFAMVPTLASSEATVLIEGETGVGKGLLAEAIHRAGPRAQSPFAELNCASITPTLIEAELFGHMRGAFTGAEASRPGVFESASGGSVFLDEIDSLPLGLQPAFLRVLEKGQVKRIGSDRSIPVNMRVIAATGVDLRQAVNKNRFRSDLFYRLNVIRVRIPPLRERRDDIPLLVDHFYRQYASSEEDDGPPAQLLATLCKQDWLGNVRELRNAVERAVILGDPHLAGHSIQGMRSDFDDTDDTTPFRIAKERAVARWERNYVERLIARHDGNQSQAARAVRMDRNHLRTLLRRYEIDLPGKPPR